MTRNAVRWLALGACVCAGLAAPSAAPARTGYAVNELAATVTPFDIATGATAPQIAIGAGLGGPGPWADSWGIAITPDGKRGYVANRRVDSVSWFDTATGASGMVPVGAPTSVVAIAPDGRTAYVNGGAGLIPIDIATNTARPVIPVPAGAAAMAISPDGKTAYVVGSGVVTPVDLAAGSAGTPIPVRTVLGGALSSIAISPDGRKAYVGGLAGVTPIDLATNTSGAPIELSTPSGPSPVFGIAIARDGTRAYTADSTSDSVTPVDLTANTALASIPTRAGAPGPLAVAISPDGTTVFATGPDSDRVTTIATATNTVSGRVYVGPCTQVPDLICQPAGIAITPNQGPRAAFTATRGHRGRTVSLDASSSVDPDGTIAGYAWDFGDGTTAATSSPLASHTYARGGRYLVTLTVTDNEGCSAVRVFTGQTMSCNGSTAAVSQRIVKVPGRHHWRWHWWHR